MTDARRVRQVLDGVAENALRLLEPGRPLVLHAAGAEPALRCCRCATAGRDWPTRTRRGLRAGSAHERYRGRRPVGAGLGLPLAHSLITRLGGTIPAGRAAEGGVAMTIRLPPAPAGWPGERWWTHGSPMATCSRSRWCNGSAASLSVRGSFFEARRVGVSSRRSGTMTTPRACRGCAPRSKPRRSRGRPGGERVPVNAIIPVVAPDRAAEVARLRLPHREGQGGRAGRWTAGGRARVAAVAAASGRRGRIRIDANAAWTVEEAVGAIEAARAAAGGTLEYVEQPCRSLVEISRRFREAGVPIAADESIRSRDDPHGVALAGAASMSR